MRCSLLIAGTFVMGAQLMAQETPVPTVHHSSSIVDARFELVQSPLIRAFTFRVDRYTGKVWQFTNVNGTEGHWEETPVPELPSGASRPRFQLLVPGTANSQPLLIDTETGKTWQFRKDNATYTRERARDGYGWEVVLDR